MVQWADNLITFCNSMTVPGTSWPPTYGAAGWGLVASPQVGSVLRGPGWNVHGDSVVFQLKKIRFEPGLFMQSFNLGVKFEFYFRCGDEELVSF